MSDWMEPTHEERTADELADEVELRIQKAHGPFKYIPVHAQWIDVAGMVLAEGPVTPRAGSDSTFDVRATADHTGTYDYMILKDAQGNESKCEMVLNTRSICCGADLKSEITITYD